MWCLEVKENIQSDPLNKSVPHAIDIGCGWHKQKDAIGIDLRDYDPYLKRHHNHNIIASADHIPFRDNSFAKAYCFEVLEHCYDPKGVLDEIHRVLKKEGILLLSIPNPYWIARFIRFCFGDYADYGAREHIFGWTYAEIDSLVSLVGFTVCNHYYMSWMYRVLKRRWFKRIIARYCRRLTNYSLMLVLRKE
jgi:SAM-dependent methyltransferase